MGTRHVVAVKVDGEYKVAQYGQWDGYPSHHGANILHFLQNNNLELFAEKVRNTKWITEKELEEVQKHIDKEQIELYKLYPELSRDTGSDVFKLIMNSQESVKLRDSLHLLSTDNIIEWAYVIDLDNKQFKVYSKREIPGLRKIREEFLRIDLVKAYALDKLPTKQEFLSELEPREEEDEEE